MENREYIRRLACFLVDNKTTMAASELAQHLNRNNFKTSYGTKYEGGRGTYRLLHTTYDWLASSGKQKDADNVAAAFSKANGDYAYE